MLFANFAHAASSRQSSRGLGHLNDDSSDSLSDRWATISRKVGTSHETSLHFQAGSVIIVLYEQTTPCSSFVNLTESEIPSSAVLSNSSALARTSVGLADWQSHPCAMIFVRRAFSEKAFKNMARVDSSRNAFTLAVFAAEADGSARISPTTPTAFSPASGRRRSTLHSGTPIVRHMSAFVPKPGWWNNTAGTPEPSAITWLCISIPKTSLDLRYTPSARSAPHISSWHTQPAFTSSGSLSYTALFISFSSVRCSAQMRTFTPWRRTASAMAALSGAWSDSRNFSFCAMAFSFGFLSGQNSQRGVTRLPGIAQTNFPGTSPCAFMKASAPFSSTVSK